MKRSQNAEAYVNAAFLIKITNGRISSARLCYGGISATFNRATETEKLMYDKDLHTNETLQTILKSLSIELKSDSVLPAAAPEYRTNLAMALFYKFVLNTCAMAKLSPQNISGGLIVDRPLSSGQQAFKTDSKTWPLTQPVSKYEGLVQCSGEAVYMNDIPKLKDELWAAFVTAKKINTKIGQIDASEALVNIAFGLSERIK